MDVFCKIIAGEIPANRVLETDKIISIMDANPFKPGHLLIIPKEHYTTILDMTTDIETEILKTAKELIKKMGKVYPGIKSVKVVVNYGEEQVVKHYHMHLIPLYDEGQEPTISQEEFCDLLKR